MKNLTEKDFKDSGLALALIFSILSIYFGNPYSVLIVIVLIASMTIPVVLKPFAYFWYGLSVLLGNIMSTLIVSIVFYIIVVPFGMMMKLFKKNALLINEFKKDVRSVFHQRNHIFKYKDIKHPY